MIKVILLIIILFGFSSSHNPEPIAATGEWPLLMVGANVGFYSFKNYTDNSNYLRENKYDNKFLPAFRIDYAPSNLKNYSFIFNFTYFTREKSFVHDLPDPDYDYNSFGARIKENSDYILYDLNFRYSLFNAQKYYNIFITTGVYNSINFNRRYVLTDENFNRKEHNYDGIENKYDFGYSMGIGYEFRIKNYEKIKYGIEYKFYDRFIKNDNMEDVYKLWNLIHVVNLNIVYRI